MERGFGDEERVEKMMIEKIWPLCQVCGGSVETAEGFLLVDDDEMHKYEEDLAIWNLEHSDEVPHSAHELAQMPETVHWKWGHNRCLPEGMYLIPAEKFDTVGKALAWTLHMMEKRWLENTDWRATVESLHEIPNN